MSVIDGVLLCLSYFRLRSTLLIPLYILLHIHGGLTDFNKYEHCDSQE